MTFSDWLDQEEGRTTMVAQHFGVTVSAVSQWRTNGVPPEKMIEVKKLSRAKVSLEEMLADRSAMAGR